MIGTHQKDVDVVGFDPGSGEGCLVHTEILLDGDKVVREYASNYALAPSLIGDANFDKFVNDRSTSTNATLASVMRPGEIAIGYDGKEYFVGTLAEKEGINTTSAKGSLKRYTDLHSRILFLALYGALVKKKLSECRLVTGAPISLFDKQNRSAIKQNLSGEHRFTWNGEERVVHVKVGTVTREGVKALAIYGDPNERDGVIDIGERTCDIGQAEGQSPINRMCKAETLGVGKVLDAIIAEIKAKYRVAVSLGNMRAVLKAYTAGRSLPPIKVSGVPIPDMELKHIIETARMREWKAIETFIDQTWNEEGTVVGSNLNMVLCIGGGSMVWRNELMQKFPHAMFPAVSPSLSHVEHEAPLVANAEAYHGLALTLADIDPTIWARV